MYNLHKAPRGKEIGTQYLASVIVVCMASTILWHIRKYLKVNMCLSLIGTVSTTKPTRHTLVCAKPYRAFALQIMTLQSDKSLNAITTKQT